MLCVSVKNQHLCLNGLSFEISTQTYSSFLYQYKSFRICSEHSKSRLYNSLYSGESSKKEL